MRLMPGFYTIKSPSRNRKERELRLKDQTHKESDEIMKRWDT
nr:hypothetical protein [Tanacetum cinerariifolium]